MKCEKCGKEYPSKYYFETDTVCINCFQRLSIDEQAEVKKRALMKYPMTSTTFEMEGYRITRQLGVVRGIVVRSRSIIGSLGAFLQTIVGGNITLFTHLCETTRAEAFDIMMDHAKQIGANAVVGIRYDTTEMMDGVTEVLCYGTAVSVEPAKKA